jgi:hypothetical protein
MSLYSKFTGVMGLRRGRKDDTPRRARRLVNTALLSVGLCSIAAAGPLASSALAGSPQVATTCSATTSFCTVHGTGFVPGGDVTVKAYIGTAVFSSARLEASTVGASGGRVCVGTPPQPPFDGRPAQPGDQRCYEEPGGEFTTGFWREDPGLACNASAAGSVQYTDLANGLVASQPVTWVGPACATTTTLSVPSMVNTSWTAVDPARVTYGSAVATSGTITISVNGSTFCSYTAGAPSGCLLANLPAGTDQVWASYSGSAAPALDPSSASATVTVFVPTTPATSPNWAGYVETGEKYSGVSATWRVPTSNCGNFPTGDLASDSSSWVGLDGWNGNSTVEQIGTDSNCAAYTGVYWAWWEMYGRPGFLAGAPVPIAHTVNAGDLMAASVVSTGTPGSYTLNIEDRTRGWVYSTTQSDPDAVGGSAECIEEQPEALGLPLTDFGSVTFGECMATGNNGRPTPVWDHPNSAVEMRSGSTRKAVVSPLSENGSQFTVTWLLD